MDVNLLSLTPSNYSNIKSPIGSCKGTIVVTRKTKPNSQTGQIIFKKKNQDGEGWINPLQNSIQRGVHAKKLRKITQKKREKKNRGCLL